LSSYLHDTRAFFAPRAATWEERYPNDMPRYAAAVQELAPPPGALVLDAGCGTGRALAPLRAAVGSHGRVLGLDATREMLIAARNHGRAQPIAELIEGDVMHLPLPAACCDAIFAGGLLPHLPDPGTGLRELARAARLGARLAIFHPASRAELAARHGTPLTEDDLLAPPRLAALLQATGWEIERIDDSADRYLALARRSI
jgi:SAM-dependent methyltransferase